MANEVHESPDVCVENIKEKWINIRNLSASRNSDVLELIHMVIYVAYFYQHLDTRGLFPSTIIHQFYVSPFSLSILVLEPWKVTILALFKAFGAKIEAN